MCNDITHLMCMYCSDPGGADETLRASHYCMVGRGLAVPYSRTLFPLSVFGPSGLDESPTPHFNQCAVVVERCFVVDWVIDDAGPSVRPEEGGRVGDWRDTVHPRDRQDAVRRDEGHQEHPRGTATARLPLAAFPPRHGRLPGPRRLAAVHCSP